MQNLTAISKNEISDISQQHQNIKSQYRTSYYQNFQIPSQAELDYLNTVNQLASDDNFTGNKAKSIVFKNQNLQEQVNIKLQNQQTMQLQEMQMQINNISIQYQQQQKLIEQLQENNNVLQNNNYKLMIKNQFLTLDQQIQQNNDAISTLNVKQNDQFIILQQLGDIQKDIVVIMQKTLKNETNQQNYKNQLISVKTHFNTKYKVLYRIIKRSKIFDLYLLQKYKHQNSQSILKSKQDYQKSRNSQYNDNDSFKQKLVTNSTNKTQQCQQSVQIQDFQFNTGSQVSGKLDMVEKQQQLINNLFGTHYNDKLIMSFQKYMRSNDIQIHYLKKEQNQHYNESNEVIDSNLALFQQLVTELNNQFSEKVKNIENVQQTQLIQFNQQIQNNTDRISVLDKTIIEQQLQINSQFSEFQYQLKIMKNSVQINQDDQLNVNQTLQNQNSVQGENIKQLKDDLFKISQDVQLIKSYQQNFEALSQEHYDEFVVYTRNLNNFELLSKCENLQTEVEKIQQTLQDNEEKVFDYIRLFQEINRCFAGLREDVCKSDQEKNLSILNLKNENQQLMKSFTILNEQLNIQIYKKMLDKVENRLNTQVNQYQDQMQEYFAQVKSILSLRDEYQQLQQNVSKQINLKNEEVNVLMERCLQKVDEKTLTEQNLYLHKQVQQIKDKVKESNKKYEEKYNIIGETSKNSSKQLTKQINRLEKQYEKLKNGVEVQLTQISTNQEQFGIIEEQLQYFNTQLVTYEQANSSNTQQQQLLEQRVNDDIQLLNQKLNQMDDNMIVKIEVQYNNIQQIEKEFKYQIKQYSNQIKQFNQYEQQMIILKEQVIKLQKQCDNSIPNRNSEGLVDQQNVKQTVFQLVSFKGVIQEQMKEIAEKLHKNQNDTIQIIGQISDLKNELLNNANQIQNQTMRLNKQREINQYFTSKFDLQDLMFQNKEQSRIVQLNEKQFNVQQQQISQSEEQQISNLISAQNINNQVQFQLIDQKQNNLNEFNQVSIQDQINEEDVRQQIQQQKTSIEQIKDLLGNANNLLQ